MSYKQLTTRISQLIQPTSYWTSSSAVILAEGEIGIDSDLNIFKIGDGVKTWSQITTYYPYIKENGTIVFNGGVETFDGLENPVTLVLATEESSRYSSSYIPKKGEPVTELTSGGLQGVKIGDGVNSFANLSYVTPYDDVIMEDYGEVEDFKI